MEDARSDGGDAAACPASFWIDGGPGDTLLRRLHLAPVCGRAGAELLTLVAVTWAPLLVLATIDGVVAGGVATPFVHDIAVHVRFLVAAPLLALADLPIGAQLDRCTAQFLTAGLVPPAERERFADCVALARRARDSRFAALVVLAAAYVAALGSLLAGEHRGLSTWYAPGEADLRSLAGLWYVLVSLPTFNFLLFRWVHRLIVWGRFLRRVARLELRLTAAHPDRAGGLGFLGTSCLPLALLLIAVNSAVASAIASRILFEAATVEQFHLVYVVLLLLGLAVITGPLVVFVPVLTRLKMHSLGNYSALAGRCAQACEQRWLGDRGRIDASLLQAPDVQALADLAAIHEIVRTTRVIPIGRRDLVLLTFAGLLPALPLLAMSIPAREVLRRVLTLMP